MKKQSNNSRHKPINVTVEVEYMPFTFEEARQEAYRLHAKLWLHAKERGVRKVPENKT
jgi:hypothetical protein